jgi:FkbM family methyltransferase
MKLTTISEAGLVYDVPTSDMQVYDETMVEQVYSLPKKIIEKSQIGFRVIDIGGHCGVASMYFWLAWQDGGLPGNFRCDTYEPNLHELCKKNLSKVSTGFSVIGKAVTGDGRNVGLTVYDDFPCCTHINDYGELPSVSSLDTIKFITGDIDVLKIDAEGAEVEIIRGYGKQLNRFRCIMLEYHSDADRRALDQMLDGYLMYDCIPCNVPRLDGDMQGVAKYIRKDLA